MFDKIMGKLFPNKIDKKRVYANLYVIEKGEGSFELAESLSKFDVNSKEILSFATKSIKKIDPIGGIPLGFPTGFIVIYPDVLLWWNSLTDERQEKILDGIDENDFLDENRKIKLKYLDIIVKAYQDTGAKLECAYGTPL